MSQSISVIFLLLLLLFFFFFGGGGGVSCLGYSLSDKES